MGKGFLVLVVAVVVAIIGMLLYPTVHFIWSGIDVTGFTSLEQGGMVLLSYGFLFWMGYTIFRLIRK